MATKNENEDEKNEALDNLEKYKEDFSAALSEISSISQEGLANGLDEHISQLIGSFDEYIEGDYSEAYENKV